MAGFTRSFFGVGKSRDSEESSDRGEIERFQKYEDLVDQDYDPFHHKCGEGVILSAKRRVAYRHGSKGIVFSAKPIPVGKMFQVKLIEKDSDSRGSPVSACTELSWMDDLGLPYLFQYYWSASLIIAPLKANHIFSVFE